MNSYLPATGTAALLELLCPLVPDECINQCWPQGPTTGRHREHTAAQLFRVHLLALLTPVHSLNLLVKLLPEQRDWRKFAGLRRQNRVPDVRMLHEFRGRVGGLPAGAMDRLRKDPTTLDLDRSNDLNLLSTRRPGRPLSRSSDRRATEENEKCSVTNYLLKAHTGPDGCGIFASSPLVVAPLRCPAGSVWAFCFF